MKLLYVKRLLKLAEHVATVSRKSLNMRMWWCESECGTSGCLLGHACQVPSFRRAGLKLELHWHGPVPCQNGQFARVVTENHGTPMYRGKKFGDAAQAFFGLDAAGVEHLFHDTMGGETPKRAANKIRRFVRRKQAEA